MRKDSRPRVARAAALKRPVRRPALAALAALVLTSCSSDALDMSRMFFDGVVERKPVSINPGVPGRETGCRTSTKSPGYLDYGAPARSYTVGPGDDLKFNIFGEQGMTDIVARVDGEGYVQLPIIEHAFVQGLTTRQIQADLKSAYSQHFVNPWVTVELANAESHPIYFLGEFKDSGVHYLEQPRTLLEALAMGGGLTPDAYLPGARLIRDHQVCIVDLHGLLKEGRFENNVYMAAGDVLFAPRKEDMQVYVLGAVGAPQAIPYGTEGRTLLEALSIAEGPIRTKALMSEIRVIRSYSATEGELLVIDAEKMLKGTSLDYPLAPGDVVYVPQTSLGNWNDAIETILPSLNLIGGILTPISMLQSL